tara:strand:+ start:297 stop:968 length:672 start_codon:yes stop_codon:yes gene_type:complete
VNLGEIRTRVFDRLDEDSASPLRWTANDVDGLINDGHQLMVARTGVLVNTTPVIARADAFSYELPRDCIRVLRVFRDSPLEKVWPVSHRELEQLRPGWRGETSTRFEWYMVFGLDEIILGPAFTTSGEAYTVTYLQDTGESYLVADSDEPVIPRRFHDSLVEYAVARALLVDADKERLEQLSETFLAFHKDAKKLKRESGRNTDRRHGARREDPDGVDLGVLA